MIEELNKIINESDNIVFFGGAGVSTESGIPDFRSQDGLYHMKYDYPPEYILSDSFFFNNTKEFYKFYFDKLVNPEIIVLLGSIALKNILGEEYGITSARGKWFEIDGKKVIATFHPAALLRDETKKIYFWKDLKEIKKSCNIIKS